MKKITYLFLLLTITICNAQCWKEISSGENHAIGIKTDGTLWSWGGDGGWGRLGQGSSTFNLNIPTQIGTASNWDKIYASTTHSIALKTDGTLWIWGGNDFGQLGLGHNNNVFTPTQVGTATWKAFSASRSHTLAIKTDGTLWAWGSNENAALGDGTLVNKNVPTLISGTTDWKNVDCNSGRSIAIKNNNTIWTWGFNSPALGLGINYAGITYVTSPTQIGTDTDWKMVVVGFGYSLALKQNNTLWGWGGNGNGQLGNGTTTNNFTPTQIGTDADWDTINVDLFSSAGVKSNGTVWTWGWNNYGQLGNNSTTSATSPVQITTNTNWVVVDIGPSFTVALNDDGSLYSWGWNYYGQIGNGTTIDQPTPLLINECTLGIEDNQLNGALLLYPNPTKDILTVELKNKSTYELYSLNGIVVKNGSLEQGTNQLALDALAAGYYLIKVTDELGNTSYEKICKH